MSALLAMVVALVADDAATLRASPRSSAPVQAQLSRGDWLEVRGEVPGYLKVYDHRRERPGYVRPEQLRVHADDAAQGPALRALVAFLRDAPGFESLGIGYAALALRADPQASATALQAAIGAMAERLAERASQRSHPDPVLAAHRAVAESYGVHFVDQEAASAVRVCYDGRAFRAVLASADAAPDERARAALALTSDRCADPATLPASVSAWNDWRLEVLQGEPGPSRQGHLLRLRRAGILAARAYQRAREGDAASARSAAQAAARDLALADPTQLAESDLPARSQAAIAVAASRFAAEAAPAPLASKRSRLELRVGRPGETCISVVADGETRLSRCTWGLAWQASARDRGLTLTLAVQLAPAWTELWVFRRVRGAWRADILAPGSDSAGPGYAEAAGFSPDGSRLLVAREALVQGQVQRRFEVRRASDLRVLASAGSPEAIPGFARLAAPDWRGQTLALR